MLRVKCPQCAKVLGLQDNVAGKMAKCPACNATFKVPAAAPQPTKAAAKAGKADKPDPLAGTPAVTGADDDGPASYAFAQDTGPADKEAIRDDRIDAMVLDAQRNKKRNAAWQQIGPPAKILKIVTMVQTLILIIGYLWTVFAVVMMIHNLDQLLAKGEKLTHRNYPYYVPPVNSFVDRTTGPYTLFWTATGIFVPSLLVCGLVLAGAECMKKLENHGLAMAGAIAGIITFLPTGLLALLVLLREPIKKEFAITELRKKGVFTEPEAEEEEDEDDEDEEGDEDAEDEEDDEDEKEKAAPARKRRG